jgi:hypothetical protein
MQSAHGQSVEVDTTSGIIPGRPTRYESTIGVDVFKNIPYLLFGNRLPAFDNSAMTLTNRGIVEVLFRQQKRERFYRTVMIGYSQVEIDSPESIERHENVIGFYGKIGNEWTLGQGKGRSKIGLRGMASYCRYTTDLVFPGPTFGDYLSTEVVHNVGIGFDPYYALDFFPGQRWMLRWETRWTQHYRLSGQGFTTYYPGVGVSLGMYDWIASLGTTLQLHYRFAGKKGSP